MLIYSPRTCRVVSISGQGPAPARATIACFREAGISLIPGNGLLAATVPAAFDAWVTALSRFGTMSLCDVMEPALELAADGFSVYPGLRRAIERQQNTFRNDWPSTAAIYLPDGAVPAVGDRLRQPDWAAAMSRTVEVEALAIRAGADREAALQAARDVFYRGPIARAIVEFAAHTQVVDHSGKAHAGLLSLDDLDSYRSRLDEPVHADYHGYDVFKCGSWTQGPVFLQQLRLLEGYDLHALGHNTPAYIHVLVEAAKLAFADRDAYYADPLFADVPLPRLLSREYAAQRRALIDLERASLTPRPRDLGQELAGPPADGGVHRHDTTHLDAIDADGLMISVTPSGAWISSSPVVEGLGFPLGTRAQMFSLDPAHPNCLAPGKRPRTTLTPSLVMRGGKPHMVFGTPGGDQQDQWTLQFFLNVIEFGMDLQEAADAASFHTDHLASSFYPRETLLGRLSLEGRIPQATRSVLEALGHRIEVVNDWANGQVCGARIDPNSGLLEACASPRGQSAYAMGY